MQDTISKLALAAQLRFLEDEDIGVRHRILCYYIPLFTDFCRLKDLALGTARVLDCGCGNGASVEYLADAGFDAVGIDIADLRRGQWQQRCKLPKVTLIQADATSLPFADNSFDIILSSGMLEHIGVFEECTPAYRVRALADQSARRRQFVAECLRVLRCNGVLFIDHPNGSFPIDFWHNDYRSRPRFHLPTQKFLPTFGEVSMLVKSIEPGCTIRAISPAGRFTFRRSQRRWYGKLFAGQLERFFSMLRFYPFSILAASPLNPYLVIRVERGAQAR